MNRTLRATGNGGKPMIYQSGQQAGEFSQFSAADWRTIHQGGTLTAHQFAADPRLSAEFGEFAAYQAYRRAEERGLIRILAR